MNIGFSNAQAIQRSRLDLAQAKTVWDTPSLVPFGDLPLAIQLNDVPDWNELEMGPESVATTVVSRAPKNVANF